MTPPGLVDVLSEHLGLAADSLGDRLLTNVTAERMRVLNMADGVAYVRRLRQDRAELDALVEAVVVPETWFYRYPQSLSYLAQWARARRGGLGERRLLRVFCVPSSTGEEPYSVAMALLLAGVPPAAFHVEACDVSTRAVERARAGVYAPSSFRERDAPDLTPFFEPVGGSRRLRPEVRQAVTVRVGNICDANLFAGVARYDVILCRNLFIYLTGAVRKSALTRFERQLAPGGLLFMGHAEPASTLDSRFVAAGPPTAFAFARAAKPDDVPDPAPVRTWDFPRPVQELVEPVAPPGELSSADRAARLGATLRAAGDLPGAERALTEAVYLEPRHRGALVELLALAEARQDWAAVANYRRRVALAGGSS